MNGVEEQKMPYKKKNKKPKIEFNAFEHRSRHLSLNKSYEQQ